MLAYAKRYRCLNNVLLLPCIGATAHRTYKLVDDSNDICIRVAYVNLGVDLRRDSESLENDLRLALQLVRPIESASI